MLAFGCEPEGRWEGGVARGSCSARVLIDQTKLDCRALGCEFVAGSYGVGCSDIECDGLEQVEGLLLSGAVEMTCLSPDEAGLNCGAAAPTGCSIYIASLDATVGAQCEQARCAPATASATCEPTVETCSPDHPIYLQILASVALGLFALGVAVSLWAKFGVPRARTHLAHADAFARGFENAPAEDAILPYATCESAETNQAPSVCSTARYSHEGNTSRAENGGLEGGSDAFRAGLELCEMLNVVRPIPVPPPSFDFHVSVLSSRTPAGAEAACSYVLSPISESLLPGKIVGVLGPSGSGKSTLLSSLASDVSEGLRAESHMQLGDVPAEDLPRGMIGYCAQDDVLTSTLTPYEAAMFAATLRLPRSVTEKQRARLVWCVLRALHLQNVAVSSSIGSRHAGGGGISGGERRRVSLAILLVSAPMVLLVDEPTSGLDARSALVVGQLLRDIVSTSGRTAMLSVHQPSSRLFATLDDILLLANGVVLYRGARSGIHNYLVACGLPTPASDLISISDHLLELAFTHPQELADATAALCPLVNRGDEHVVRCDALRYAQHRALRTGVRNGWAATITGARRVSYGRVARELAWRCGVQLARNSTMLRMQLGVALGMAALMGLAFFSVSADAAGFQNKAGAMQITLVLFAFGGVSMLPAVASEWAIVWREWHSGFYPAWLYTVIKLAFDLCVLRLLPSILFGSVFYALMGLRRELDAFFLFQLTLALANVAAGLYCSAIGTALPGAPGAAALLAIVTMLISTTLSGLELNLQTLPSYLAWLPRLSFCSYAFEILLTTELEGTTVLVEIPGAPPVRLGAQVLLDLFGLSSSRIWTDLGALVAFVIGAFCLNCLIVAVKLNRLVTRLEQAVARALGRGRCSRFLRMATRPQRAGVRASAVTAEAEAAANERAATAQAEVAKLKVELREMRVELERLRHLAHHISAAQTQAREEPQGDSAMGDTSRPNPISPPPPSTQRI